MYLKQASSSSEYNTYEKLNSNILVFVSEIYRIFRVRLISQQPE